MSVMAQVYAAKKTGDFLSRNWLKILGLILVLYLGYRISQGIKGLGEIFKWPEFKWPEFMWPEFKFPEFMWPEFKFPEFMWPTPMSPNITPMPNATPNSGTGLIDIPPELANELTMRARELEQQGMLRMGQSFAEYKAQMERDMLESQKGLVPYILPDGRRVYVKPDTVSELNRRYMIPMPTMQQYAEPIGPEKMGLMIDMPTKMGMPTMVNKIADALSQQRIQIGNVRVPALSLSGLIAMNPGLTASQAADLRYRIINPPSNFDFGTNTGSGRLYQFDDMGRVIGSTRNPVLQAYEAYRAMYS